MLALGPASGSAEWITELCMLNSRCLIFVYVVLLSVCPSVSCLYRLLNVQTHHCVNVPFNWWQPGAVLACVCCKAGPLSSRPLIWWTHLSWELYFAWNGSIVLVILLNYWQKWKFSFLWCSGSISWSSWWWVSGGGNTQNFARAAGQVCCCEIQLGWEGRQIQF